MNVLLLAVGATSFNVTVLALKLYRHIREEAARRATSNRLRQDDLDRAAQLEQHISTHWAHYGRAPRLIHIPPFLGTPRLTLVIPDVPPNTA